MHSSTVANTGGRAKTFPYALVGFVVLATIGLMLAVEFLANSPSKKGPIEGLIIAALPLALYIAIRRPFIFPFCLFVILVPFDNLLDIPGFGTLTKLLAICSGAALLFWFIRKKQYIKPDHAMYLWLMLLVWMGITVFWSINADDALSTLATWVELALLYVVISIAPISHVEYKAFMLAVVFGGIISACFGVYLFHSGAGIIHGHIGNDVSARVVLENADNTKIDQNAFAAALLLPLSLVITWALGTKPLLAKGAYSVLFAVLLAGVYVSGSRGAIVALAAMILYMAVRGRHRVQLLFLAGLGLASSLFMKPSPWVRFEDAASTGGSGRIDIWKVGLDALKHHWVAGAGIGNFPDAYDESFIRVHQEIFQHWHRVAHNELITTSVELGALGFILFLCCWYWQFRVLRFVPRDSGFFDTRIALESATIGLFIAAQFLLIMTGKFTWLLFCLMAATRSLLLTVGNRQIQTSLSPITGHPSSWPGYAPERVSTHA
jgi:putative inorganic carbon (HCO3(-)) transporter